MAHERIIYVYIRAGKLSAFFQTAADLSVPFPAKLSAYTAKVPVNAVIAVLFFNENQDGSMQMLR